MRLQPPRFNLEACSIGKLIETNWLRADGQPLQALRFLKDNKHKYNFGHLATANSLPRWNYVSLFQTPRQKLCHMTLTSVCDTALFPR